MRSKGNIKIPTRNGRFSLSKLYGYMLNQNYSLIRRKTRKIFGCDIFLSIRKNENNEIVYIISDTFYDDPFAEYAKRWLIEIMFSNFKKRDLI